MSIGNSAENEEMRTVEDLRTSEVRYRRLFESARDGILILDAVTRKITDVNPFMVELLGYTREEFLDRELWEIGVLKDKAASVTAFIELQMKDYIRYDDLPLKTKNGTTREVEFVSNIYTEGGREVVQCNIRDVTDRKIEQAEMRQAEITFRRLVESLPGIVYLNEPDPPYATTYVSPNVRAFGYRPEEWYDKPDMWNSIIHEKDRERVIREFTLAAGQEHETEMEYRIIARDGTTHWWQDKGCFIFDTDGKRLGRQGIIIDITKTKGLERQLRQANKLESVGMLAGGVAHDFNNMLTAITGYSDLALRKLREDDPLRYNIEEVRKASERAAILTQQLLAFSRRQVMVSVVLDLNAVISDTIRMLQMLIGENIQLTGVFSPDLGRVLADPGQVSQIIMNLAVNARDAMPEGGKLTIETSNIFLGPGYSGEHFSTLPGSYVMIAVSDTGTGMSEEVKQQAFEPFFTTKEAGRGTGLGLATVYGIVNQSGGTIEIYSEERVGTTFKIYLPRVVAELGELPIERTFTETPIGSETILLVEDELLVRNLTRQVLEECGYTVIEAGNGLEALAKTNGGTHIDLLITDVVMPKMGGRELAEKLVENFPAIKVLFTSGYTDDAIIRHGIIEAHTNFIQKPFTPDSLARKIRVVLDRL
jgi:two-component system, cell cycle sensor histidine kinase and response regulator CckA